MAFPFGRLRNWIKGQLVQATDMLDVQQAIRGMSGSVACAISGVQNFLPNGSGALALVPAGGMNVTLGGATQYVFLEPEDGSTAGCKLAYSLQSYAIAIDANASGSQRNDLICLQYQTGTSDVYDVPVRADNGQVSTKTVSKADETFVYEKVVGTPGAGDPAVPAGFVAFARVRVASGAASIDAAHIDILFPTAGSAIGVTLGGYVKSLNTLQGALSLTSSDNSILIDPSGSTIDLKRNTAGGAFGAVLGMLVKAGGGGDYNPSIILPNDGGEYLIELFWAYSGSSNNNSQQQIGIAEGVITTISNTGDNNFSQNASYYSCALFTGTAAANQTIGFSLGSSMALESSAWILRAYRTA